VLGGTQRMGAKRRRDCQRVAERLNPPRHESGFRSTPNGADGS
jgi:hypothetical protein